MIRTAREFEVAIEKRLVQLEKEDKTASVVLAGYSSDLPDNEYDYMRYELPAMVELFKGINKWLKDKHPSYIEIYDMLKRSYEHHNKIASSRYGGTQVTYSRYKAHKLEQMLKQFQVA